MGKTLAILTLVILLGVGVFFGQEYFRPSVTPDESPASLSEKSRVSVTHAVKDGVHRYSGTFLLPHSCFSVEQTGTYQNNHISVSFDVEDVKTPGKTCVDITTRYPFTVLIEAPDATPATFFLNDEEVPSKIRELDWQDAVGTFIDTSVTSPAFH